jgi:hypothetical protein
MSGSGRDGYDPRRHGQGAAGPGGRGRGSDGQGSDGRGPRGPGGSGRGPGGGDIFGEAGNFTDRSPDPGKDWGMGTAAQAGPDGLRAGPALRWIGALSTRTAIYILLAATLLGVIGTLLTRSEPGFLLGFLILAGSVAATVGIWRSAVYVIIPLPALANFIGAVVTGAIHDRGVATSKTALAAYFLQWIADVFFWICATTIIVAVVAGGRWLLGRQLVSGQLQMPAARRDGGRGPGPAPAAGRRPDRDPRDDRVGAGAQGANRDQRDSRDAWGDRRPPSPRQSPSGPQQGRGNRGLPPDRSSRDQRPNRDQRDPRDPWTQR